MHIDLYKNKLPYTPRYILRRSGHADDAVTADPVATSCDRVEHLKILVQLRKLYRNLLRAERLLGTPSPVHQKPVPAAPAKVKGMQTQLCLLF